MNLIEYWLILSCLAVQNYHSITFPVGFIFKSTNESTEGRSDSSEESTEAEGEATTSSSMMPSTTSSSMTPSCGAQTDVTYCDEPPNYPDKHILDAVIKQQNFLRPYFDDLSEVNENTELSIGNRIYEDTIEELFSYNNATKDTVEEPFSYTNATKAGISVPSDNFTYPEAQIDYTSSTSIAEDDFDNVCNMRKTHITPRAARNTKGEFKFIVNKPDGNSLFTQKVEVGECVHSGSECGGGALFEQQTECRQQFLEHKLVSVSQDGLNVIVDTFKFPSCCTCHFSTQGF